MIITHLYWSQPGDHWSQDTEKSNKPVREINSLQAKHLTS